MSISVNKEAFKLTRNYLLYTIFTGLFGMIYEHFSHGVYSGFMLYAFFIPLMLGALPILLLARTFPGAPFKRLLFWHFGLIVLTTGSQIQGVLDIYGTTNRLIWAYPAAGVILCILGAGAFLLGLARNR